MNINSTRLDNHYQTIIGNYMRIENHEERISTNEYRLDVHANEIIANYMRIENTNARIDLLQEDVLNNTARIDALEGDMSHLRNELYSGMSAVAAMGAIPEAAVGRTAVGVGYGTFGGQDAIAFGVAHRTENGKHAFKLTGSYSANENGVSAGYSFSF